MAYVPRRNSSATIAKRKLNYADCPAFGPAVGDGRIPCSTFATHIH